MNLIVLAFAFGKIGLFGFGGGLAMLPLMYQSIQRFGFMSSADFSDLVALSQVTPGPIAVNAATFVGMRYAGAPGAVIATLSVCLPAFVLMLIATIFLEKFKNNRYIEGAFEGLRPVIIGLIASAAVTLCEGVIVNGELITTKLFTAGVEYYNFVSIAIFLVSFFLMHIFNFRAVRIMLVMGGIGAIVYGCIL